jgi:hypothetical protein
MKTTQEDAIERTKEPTIEPVLVMAKTTKEAPQRGTISWFVHHNYN